MNFLCGVMRARLGRGPGRARSSLLLDAAEQAADVVARLALVEQLAEHLDARDDRLLACRVKPMISTSSPTLMMPRSMRPVTTVPRPLIENTSSIAIRNGLSMSRTGSGM